MELGNFRWHVRTWHKSRAKDSKAVVALRMGKDSKAVEAHRSRNRRPWWLPGGTRTRRAWRLPGAGAGPGPRKPRWFTAAKL